MMSNPVMPGVQNQALRVHSADSVVCRNAIDRRDCVSSNGYEIPHEFCCTHVVHFTENDYAASIGLLGTNQPFSFNSKQCWISNNLSFNLTWWSPLPPNNWEDVVESNLSTPSEYFYDGGIATSSAFDGDSLCGPLGFGISWMDILQQYAASRERNRSDVEFRVLGTFLYRKEIMYAVLVCMRGDAGVESFPLVPSDGGTEAFLPMQSNFVWKVYSTVGYSENSPRPFGVDWTWDHISFGFNCPSPTSNLNLQPRFCKIIGKDATRNKPLTRLERYPRSRDEMKPSPHLVISLNYKILRAKDEISCYFR